MSKKVLQEIDLASGKKYFTELKEATSTETGFVKPDGTTITIDEDGTIHSIGGGEGSSTFIGLTDAPDSYSGQGGKYVGVNSGATGLEFKNPPLVPDQLSDLLDDSTHRLVTDTEKTTWNAKSDFSGSYTDLTDKPTLPTIPTALADLTDDATHRLVSDTDKNAWNAKQDALIADTDYLTPNTASSTYEPKKGTDDNYVTDAEKTLLSNTSGVNTGDETESSIKTKLGIETLSGSNTGDQDLSVYALKNNVLEKYNTEIFVPYTDYEPATKIYVDTTIDTKIGNSTSYFEANLVTGVNALFDIVDSSLPDNPTVGTQIFVKFNDSNGNFQNSFLKLNSGYYNPLYFNGAFPVANGIKINGLYVCYFNGTEWDMVSNFNLALNSTSEYADAIPYANGDYLTKILTSDENLEGVQIQLYFPLAIDNTKDARLKVLNGSTFYNIKDSNGEQLLASKIETKFLTLYHNGAEWIVSDLPTQYTDENAQDAVGTILIDSSEIDFTYNDSTPSITASIKNGSIDESKLDSSVNASLDLADSALQTTDIINNLTSTSITDVLSANQGKVLNDKFAKHIMTLSLSTAQSITANSGVSVKLNLNTAISVGTKLTYDSTRNGIKIGSGVSKVLVSHNVGFQWDFGDVGVVSYISKSVGGEVARANSTNGLSRTRSTSQTPKLISVAENDILTTYVYPDGGNISGKQVLAGNNTYLTIEVVE